MSGGSQRENSFGQHPFAQHPRQVKLTSCLEQIKDYHMVCGKGVSGALGKKMESEFRGWMRKDRA